MKVRFQADADLNEDLLLIWASHGGGVGQPDLLSAAVISLTLSLPVPADPASVER